LSDRFAVACSSASCGMQYSNNNNNNNNSGLFPIAELYAYAEL